MRERDREILLTELIGATWPSDADDVYAEILLEDVGGIRELAFRLDDVGDGTHEAFIAEWQSLLFKLDENTLCWLAQTADDPAMYLASLVDAA